MTFDELASAYARLRLDDQLDGLVKCPVELRAHRFQRGKLDIKHFAGLGQMTHAVSLPGKPTCFN